MFVPVSPRPRPSTCAGWPRTTTVIAGRLASSTWSQSPATASGFTPGTAVCVSLKRTLSSTVSLEQFAGLLVVEEHAGMEEPAEDFEMLLGRRGAGGCGRLARRRDRGDGPRRPAGGGGRSRSRLEPHLELVHGAGKLR